MNVDTYRHQHIEIMDEVTTLRGLMRGGVASQADAIARRVARMGAGVRFHLAAEERVLYPALQNAADERLAAIGRRHLDEMSGLREAFGRFLEKWCEGARIAAHPEDFREDANVVLKVLHDRIQKENRELYPAAERL